MNQKKGSELSYADQQEVLKSFSGRFTCQNLPTWARKPAPNGKFYAPQYSTDGEWLERTSFAVTSTGKLDRRVNECSSRNESWPLGQWLTAPYARGAQCLQ